ncbi:DUF5996 family protein [Gillisia marina]|uniref:DUF5996 family protein n=1 Tax=Gillisia marina TaxID=1167637 RepID=UPI00029A8458|nr:DUF5996 family protein [Gillisia marina]
MKKENWPALSYQDAKGTYETIHLWTQIAGKVKLTQMPWINHSWHTTLFVSPRGLTTGDIPSENKHFQINFDFIDNELQIVTSQGESNSFDLKNMSVAGCYKNVIGCLKDFGIDVKINTTPNEMVDPIPLDKDEQHNEYDPEHASKWHTVLLNVDEVFNKFRAEFIGKSSPVHFFWGSFDLAVSRFSGKEAPKHPGGIPNLPDWVAQEAYSHEVSSSGFWPGNEMLPFAAFYNYIYPEPKKFNDSHIRPKNAYYFKDMGEFILPYKDVQQSADPSKMLLAFLHSTYNNAADLANWDRKVLEKQVVS